MPPKRQDLTPEYIEQSSIPEPNSGCWIWLNGVGNYGYGQCRLLNGPSMNASRASYIAFHGSVEDGMDVDHKCRNPICVNPDHLQAITHRENCRLRNAISKTCKNGHVFDYTDSRGARRCHTCDNEVARRSWHRRKAARKTLAIARKSRVDSFDALVAALFDTVALLELHCGNTDDVANAVIKASRDALRLAAPAPAPK